LLRNAVPIIKINTLLSPGGPNPRVGSPLVLDLNKKSKFYLIQNLTRVALQRGGGGKTNPKRA